MKINRKAGMRHRIPAFYIVLTVKSEELKPTAKKLGPDRNMRHDTAALNLARAETVRSVGEDMHLYGNIKRQTKF